MIKEHIESWKQWLIHNQNYSINTLNSYSRDVNEFILFLDNENIDIKYATKSDVLKYIKMLKNKGIVAITISQKISSLRNFFKYLYLYKDISIDILNNVRIEIKDKKIIKCLSEKDIENIVINYKYYYCRKEVLWITTRNKTIILLMYGCGLRISEVLNIRINDIKDGRICILGKGRKERVIYIHPKILRWIEKYKQQIPFEIKDKLFVHYAGKELTRFLFFHDFKQIKKQFNLAKEITPHSLRYSYTSHLLEAGADLRGIQETLGHVCITTTERYINISKKDLIETVATKHPRNFNKI